MPSLAKVEVFAPAKINLTLHVTGQRADGYHLLDSLVAFAGVGDRVIVEPGEGFSILGSFSNDLSVTDDNLVLRARNLFGDRERVKIELHKSLPIASGIGGGSADAAATLRAISDLTGIALPSNKAILSLGADVPVCLAGRSCRMRGIGEWLDPVARLPEAWFVLVNPGLSVPTPAVFRALEDRNGVPMPDELPRWTSVNELAEWLAGQRNDLQRPAIKIQPAIETVLQALQETDGCLISRMSGSGATCFGLFADAAQANRAAADIAKGRPDWWIAPAPILSGAS
ncbi:4-(cytidine 5'-diphospho)-2-C-methyl-D-erythritol kinase [Qingshengfaniella alkalisoli]|uniref:4-diphosphocytidyl-2-C-methyl-D-erythritol kinase n=1 Tax=Qingshengfaniella alkalisoli TaxID=2599296 RepID=A0A5B8I8B8_9RHOB|nr:4-(cytidine 5'-diphospho)-2-C-methyl-D-erythritol kinase [Qingshengfaniella alkalisoli]